MVADFFDSLLQDLGKTMDIQDLHLDDANTCLVKFQSGLQVFMEPYKKGDFMLICSYLGHMPAGRYRTDVFREALKTNGLPFPRYGTFGYSDHTDQLVLFSLLSLKELNGEKIAAFLYPFMEKAERWKKSIEGGEIPLADTMKTSRIPAFGMFGLRP